MSPGGNLCVSRVALHRGHRSLQSSGRMGAYKSRLLSSILHLLIHHYPSIARIVSIQISDIRLIFDDLDGLELTIKDVRLGVKVHFEGNSDPSDAAIPTPQSPASPSGDFRRLNPLSIPDEVSPPTSAPGSPLGQFSSFAFPGTSPEPMPDVGPSPRLSRMAHARRRASVFQSRMTSTAGQIWSRAIARAHGSVSFSASIQDVALILPHNSAPRSNSTRMSFADITPSNSNGMSHRASTKSLQSDKPSQPRSFRSVGSFHSILRPRARSIAPIPAGGYETLISLEGSSTAVLALGFGPKKGLLGEDTLRTTIDLGKLSTTLDAAEKLQALVKMAKPKQEQPVAKKSPWSPKSMPRVSCLAPVFEAHLTPDHPSRFRICLGLGR